jgi:hypothetical protein
MNIDIHMSYRVKNEDQEKDVNNITTRETTTVNKSAVNIVSTDLKKTLDLFIKEMPDDVISIEIYSYENEDINSAVSRY